MTNLRLHVAKQYLCPRCKKRNMHKNGHNRDGAPRWLCRSGKGEDREYCYSTIHPTAPYRDSRKRPKKADDVRKPFRKKLNIKQTLVFTAAQNATPTHEGFFASLKTFCDAEKGELNVIPLRYKNPTSIFTGRQESDEYWLRDVAERELAAEGINLYNYRDKEGELYVKHGIGGEKYMSWTYVLNEYVKKYLYEQRKQLNKNLVVVGDVKIQPTAADPLTGMEGMTHAESGIFGHTKLRMKCVATPQKTHPKVLTTTGACTLPNYTDSKAGKKGDFHHVLGAVVVQIESPTKFHIHHINARKSDGAFIFKTKAYYPDRVEDAPRYKALVMGDAHYRFADASVVDATFGKGGLVDTLDPEVLVWHDLLDCYFGNPHHKDNPFIRKAKYDAGYHLAREEVEETVAWLLKLGADRENVIVASNHDDMFARWILREDWKLIDTDNMEFYLETALQMAQSAKMSDIGAEYDDPFAYWVNQLLPYGANVRTLKRNESYTVGGIMLDNHGDKGPSGARGTVKNLSQIGAKVVSGHGHTPAIQDGHTRTGTMTRLEAEYTDGPGNWLNTHVSIDGFDKRHLHTCVDGKFWV